MGRLQQCVYRVEPAVFPADFANRVERFRDAARLSWRALARELRLNVRSVHRWRTGARPDAGHLFALFSLAAELGLIQRPATRSRELVEERFTAPPGHDHQSCLCVRWSIGRFRRLRSSSESATS